MPVLPRVLSVATTGDQLRTAVSTRIVSDVTDTAGARPNAVASSGTRR